MYSERHHEGAGFFVYEAPKDEGCFSDWLHLPRRSPGFVLAANLAQRGGVRVPEDESFTANPLAVANGRFCLGQTGVRRGGHAHRSRDQRVALLVGILVNGLPAQGEQVEEKEFGLVRRFSRSVAVPGIPRLKGPEIFDAGAGDEQFSQKNGARFGLAQSVSPVPVFKPRAVVETGQVKVGRGVEFHLVGRQHDGGGKIPVVFPAGDDPRVALLIDRSDFPDGLARQKPAVVDGPNYFVESHAARFM